MPLPGSSPGGLAKRMTPCSHFSQKMQIVIRCAKKILLSNCYSKRKQKRWDALTGAAYLCIFSYIRALFTSTKIGKNNLKTLIFFLKITLTF